MTNNLKIFLLFLSVSAGTIAYGNRPGKAESARNPWYLEDFRFGGGIGTGLYVTNQVDYAITTNFGPFKELQNHYTFGVFKVLNEDFEAGIHYRNGHLLSLKSENTQGTSCDFDEVQIQVNYSLNHDVGMTAGRYTINAQAGLGANRFRSMYFLVDPNLKQIDQVVSTVGYENSIISWKDEPNKVTTLIGNLGIVLGYRLSQNFMLYWENSLNMSISNKMSGNLMKKHWLPPDSYFFSGLGLYINFTTSKDKLSCPKF